MDLPIVDKETALARLDGDRDLWEEIRDIWLSDAGSMMDAVEGAAARRSAEELRRAAHALKGASGNVGAVRASTAARDLEKAAPGADWDALEELLGALREVVRRTREELSRP